MSHCDQAASAAMGDVEVAQQQNRVVLHALQTAHPVLLDGLFAIVHTLTFQLGAAGIAAAVYLAGRAGAVAPHQVTLMPHHVELALSFPDTLQERQAADASTAMTAIEATQRHNRALLQALQAARPVTISGAVHFIQALHFGPGCSSAGAQVYLSGVAEPVHSSQVEPAPNQPDISSKE